ncbi:hypothetical protein GCWU000325_02150 [Alloprevotella tannerae ATCC 51259]|uniref:Uncharacterized protein n=1 Tax=Alloprevotella tannerae ATCC 51259 TaxID=626522 RepID=C9LIU1_9BACT|nr:hypothetical protein GCWU000325_02150 [Alloprevotella tannerae ATCC 51259]
MIYISRMVDCSRLSGFFIPLYKEICKPMTQYIKMHVRFPTRHYGQ